ncbi:MAG: hypothetical protein Pg6C_15490 [Treponemataceae bacterium]|nr:MAG: hypothetical protein Pg6C_15490 [Treponemataceae bacterium]
MNCKQCPCCGNVTLESEGLFDVCEICEWQDDNIQRLKPDYTGGANAISLNEAKAAFKKGIPLAGLRSAAKKRAFDEEVEQARKQAEARGEEFSRDKYIRWLIDEA